MPKSDIDRSIDGKIMDPMLLKTFLSRIDDYGESMVKKTITKLEYAMEIANTFNFDSTVVSAIMVFHDFSVLCCKAESEEFLKRINPNYSQASHAKSMARKILGDIESDKVNTIITGVGNVINGINNTPEEQIVDIVNFGYDFVDSMADARSRSIVMTNYTNEVLKRSNERKALVAVGIPPNKIKTREKVMVLDKVRLEKSYEYYLENYTQIPQIYLENLGDDMSLEEKVAYFVATKEEKVFRKNMPISRKGNQEVSPGE